jgi:hypothetical protein
VGCAHVPRVGDRVGRAVLIYWLMFGFPSAMALFERYDDDRPPRFGFAWLIALLSLALLIGFRWKTGGDWANYDRMVEQALWMPKPLGWLADPGFTLLTSYAARSRIGVLLVTVVSGALMSVALTVFSLRQPRPWLCLAVAIPYLVVVMGMGYIRQGMAISLLMMGLGSLRQGDILRYSAWVFAGSLFHSTALVLLPLGILVSNRNVVIRGLLVALVGVVLVYAIYSARADLYVANYVDAAMTSSGAAVRLIMTAVPGALFLGFRDRFALAESERSVWTVLSLAAIAALGLLLAIPSSTVVDRMGLYLLPLQCFVCARLPGAFAKDRTGDIILTTAILALYAGAFFIWLNFAVNVDYWLPYRSYFFEDGICLAC